MGLWVACMQAIFPVPLYARSVKLRIPNRADASRSMARQMMARAPTCHIICHFYLVQSTSTGLLLLLLNLLLLLLNHFYFYNFCIYSGHAMVSVQAPVWPLLCEIFLLVSVMFNSGSPMLIAFIVYLSTDVHMLAP